MMGFKSSGKLSLASNLGTSGCIEFSILWMTLAFSLINVSFNGIPTFCFLIIHSLRALSICSCWPALIFFDFFNAPGLKSTVFIHSLYFSKIIEMAEQLIPYLSMVIFLSTKTCFFKSSMILNFCSFVFFEVLEEPSLINIFFTKIAKEYGYFLASTFKLRSIK